jgi:hypothetical protein
MEKMAAETICLAYRTVESITTLLGVLRMRVDILPRGRSLSSLGYLCGLTIGSSF